MNNKKCVFMQFVTFYKPLINVTISKEDFDDYISITDIAKAKIGNSRSADVVKNWMRNRATLEFLGTWEQIYNPDFKVVEFDHFKREAGLHTFVLSVSEWIERTVAKIKKGNKRNVQNM